MQPGSTPALVPPVASTGNRGLDIAKGVQAELAVRGYPSVIVPWRQDTMTAEQAAAFGAYTVIMTSDRLRNVAIGPGPANSPIGVGAGIFVGGASATFFPDSLTSGYTVPDWAASMIVAAEQAVKAIEPGRIDPNTHYDPVTGQDLSKYALATEASGWKSMPLPAPAQPPIPEQPAPAGFHWETFEAFGVKGRRLVPDAALPAGTGASGTSVSVEVIDAIANAVVAKMAAKLTLLGQPFVQK